MGCGRGGDGAGTMLGPAIDDSEEKQTEDAAFEELTLATSTLESAREELDQAKQARADKPGAATEAAVHAAETQAKAALESRLRAMRTHTFAVGARERSEVRHSRLRRAIPAAPAHTSHPNPATVAPQCEEEEGNAALIEPTYARFMNGKKKEMARVDAPKIAARKAKRLAITKANNAATAAKTRADAWARLTPVARPRNYPRAIAVTAVADAHTGARRPPPPSNTRDTKPQRRATQERPTTGYKRR